jgi:hypothetical protein
MLCLCYSNSRQFTWFGKEKIAENVRLSKGLALWIEVNQLKEVAAQTERRKPLRYAG